VEGTRGSGEWTYDSLLCLYYGLKCHDGKRDASADGGQGKWDVKRTMTTRRTSTYSTGYGYEEKQVLHRNGYDDSTNEIGNMI
jgi:hypothetical protein